MKTYEIKWQDFDWGAGIDEYTEEWDLESEELLFEHINRELTNHPGTKVIWVNEIVRTPIDISGIKQ